MAKSDAALALGYLLHLNHRYAEQRRGLLRREAEAQERAQADEIGFRHDRPALVDSLSQGLDLPRQPVPLGGQPLHVGLDFAGSAFDDRTAYFRHKLWTGLDPKGLKPPADQPVQQDRTPPLPDRHDG